MSLCIDVERLKIDINDYMTITDFTSVVNSMLPEPQAGLLNGILFGTKATISRDFYDALVKTGTLHIIALSGTNITILTNLVSITLLRFISRRVASLLTIIIIIGFILFVGPSASVVRAGIMGSLALLAVIFGRQTWSLLFLILAAAGMLLINPIWITDIGFQLSIAATLGIILFGKKIDRDAVSGAVRGVASSILLRNCSRRVLPRAFPQEYPQGDPFLGVPRPVSPADTSLLEGCAVSDTPRKAPLKVFWFFWSFIEDDLRVTLAAQTFTIPLILFHFHRISLVSPLTNILIGWTIAPITVFGLIATVVGWVLLPLGTVIGWVVWVPLAYLVHAVWFTSMLPFASFSW